MAPVMSYDEGENNTYKEQLKAKIKKMVERTDEEDYILLLEAAERLANNKTPATSIEDVLKELGISEQELAVAEDVEIE